MAIAVVTGSSANAAVTASSQTLSTGSGVQGGDYIFVAQSFNPTLGVSATPTINGVSMTVLGTVNYSTTHRLVVWYKVAAGSIGAASADASQSVVLSNGGVSQAVWGCMEVWRGVGSIAATGQSVETVAATSHTTGSCTAGANNTQAIAWMSERSTTTPTVGTNVNCNASGYTRLNQAFQSSGASVEGGVFAYATVQVAAGTTVGGASWSGWVSNVQVVSLTAALSPLGAIANAGPDQTVTPGTTVTLSGSATGTSGTVTYAWTQVSGPTISLTNPSTQTPTFTPTTADQYVFQLAVTDNNGTVTDTVQINVTSTSPLPVAVVSPGNWTAVSSSGQSLITTLTDNSDASYDQSSGDSGSTGDTLKLRIAPASIGSNNLAFFVRAAANGTGKTVTHDVSVRDLTSNTVVATFPTTTLTTTMTTYPYIMTSAQVAAITDPNNLSLEILEKTS